MPTAPQSLETASRRVLPFVFFTAFLDLIGFGIILPLLPFYVEKMGGTAETVGFIFMCFSLTQLAATPVLGRMSDRFGRRRVILISLAGNAAAMIAFALATKWLLLPLLFASRIFAGATSGNLSACQAAISDVTTDRDRAEGMGRLGAGVNMGLILGPIVGSQLSRMGPWFPPLAAGALAAIDLVAAFFFMPETLGLRAKLEGAKPATAALPSDAPNTNDAARAESAEPPAIASHVAASSLIAASRASAAPTVAAAPVSAPSAPSSSLATLFTPAIAAVLALHFLSFLCITNMQVALGLLAKLRLGWGPDEIGWLFSVFAGVSFAIQAFFIGRMVRRFGELAIVMVGSTCTAVGLVLIAQGQHAAALFAGAAVFGGGFGMTLPPLSSLASRTAPDGARGLVLGVAQSSGGLARAIGPLMSGVLFRRVAPGAPFVGGAIAALLCVAVGATMRSPTTKS